LCSPVDEDPAFLRFAIWAFGNDGLPNLQILAWGDFSHPGKWKGYNILLCKDESFLGEGLISFRTLLDSDISYWDLIDYHMDMSASCPADSIFD
jgi:hypothetical protein